MAELLTGVDFTIILDEIKAVIPVILPVTLGFMGFRKAWAFLKGQVASA